LRAQRGNPSYLASRSTSFNKTIWITTLRSQ
jgi:hypothetical protein